jgi:hypothetical protein
MAMKAVTKFVAGGVGLAALASAAPAAAQYYPGYPGYGTGGIGQVISQVLGGGQYGGYGYNGYNTSGNDRVMVDRCAAAVQQRIDRDYGYSRYGSPYGYGAYGAYGYGQGQGRVLGITSVERRSSGLRVRGVATANAYGAGYGSNPYGGYGNYQPQGELSFKCNIDYRGYIRDIDLDRNNYAYGYRR